MSTNLKGCEGCGRHIRITEPVCPFCGASLSNDFRTPRARSAALGRVGRAAFVAAGTAVVAGIVACSNAPSEAALYGMPSVEDAGEDTSFAAAYGIPFIDAGDAGTKPDAADAAVDATSPTDASDANFSSDSIAPAYGIPALDGGN